MKKTVVIGMSGGVDSSVAAYILKQQGYSVIGVSMKLLDDNYGECEIENGGCCGLSGIEDARHVANLLDIPFYVINFKNEFKNKVVDYFIYEYMKGNTPNPCIACNRYIKWGAMLNKAKQLEADFIATGHYALIERSDETGRFLLKKSKSAAKDQTYALYNLTQEQLSKTLMPIGAYDKDEVRKIALEIGLNVANKPDSQDICFVPDKNYAKFIEGNTGSKHKEGKFIDVNGKELGTHKGITNYTIGQRKNLGISFGERVYVKNINVESNTVTLSDDASLYENSLTATDINLIKIPEITKPIRCQAKIRYNQSPSDCVIEKANEHGVIVCTFDKPQRAITPGQSVVFYDNDYVIGGATITNSCNK